MTPSFIRLLRSNLARKGLALALFGAVLCCVGGGTAKAAVCANGVYRAGCAGPNGAVVVNKGYHSPGYRPPYRGPGVACASGPYRAGCAGPNGAVVRRY